MASETPQETLQSPPARQKAKGRGKETLFRVSVRNQIELIAIADNKANMILGINVLLLSVLIAFFGSGQPIAGKSILSTPDLFVPFGILMTACLGSAVFAIFAAKPQLIKSKNIQSKSLLFFDNIYRETLTEYIDDMNNLLSDREKIYEQMIIDMYHNGVVLKNKYRQLNYSYIIFLIGLLVSVGTLLAMVLT